MNNEIYLSTGSLVERRNNYDKNTVKRIVPSFIDRGICDGAELMMIKAYYPKLEATISDFLNEGVLFPVTHCDKDVGTLLSNAAVIRSESKKESERLKTEAYDMFKVNAEAAAMAGSKRMVLHLWGGLSSDNAVRYNIEWLDGLIEIADTYKVRLLIENVPSALTDPLNNWKMISETELEKTGLVFDTRFATCHRQPKETLTDKYVNKHIEHVHISDYIGGLKEFSCLRPVYHPGEGTVDFELIFSLLKENGYSGTFTLESQGIREGNEIDVNTLQKSLEFIRNNAENM